METNKTNFFDLPEEVSPEAFQQALLRACRGDATALQQCQDWTGFSADIITRMGQNTLAAFSDMEKLERARQGDITVLPAVHRLFETYPSLLSSYPTIEQKTEDSLLEMMHGTNLLEAEVTRRSMTNLWNGLMRPNPTELEKTVAHRVVICWTQVNYFEQHYAQNADRADVKWSGDYQKRLDHANKRYLQAAKALAQVQKLKLPDIQINLAEKQINVVQNGIQQNIPRRQVRDQPSRASITSKSADLVFDVETC